MSHVNYTPIAIVTIIACEVHCGAKETVEHLEWLP
jgi:hypothetical protein